LPNLELLKLANNQTFPVKGRPIKIFFESHPSILKKWVVKWTDMSQDATQ